MRKADNDDKNVEHFSFNKHNIFNVSNENNLVEINLNLLYLSILGSMLVICVE